MVRREVFENAGSAGAVTEKKKAVASHQWNVRSA
jgi:hypothetical protein